ncbi:hypothetical protein [Caballeronia sp. BCC1704]|uniref:hypothetical protein n=1 Tax=Caballeronia sp. BCC1704 TaxID=2676300 RepID=UPI0015884378|nr:hypothetical protein [Caballeronia sp. BCC1704]
MCRYLLLLIFIATSAFAGEGDESLHHRSDGGHLPVVFDAQGREVGPLASFSGGSGVFIAIDGEPVFVRIDHKRLGAFQYSASEYEWVGGWPGYASTDCSGGVLVPLSDSPVPAIAVRDGVDVTLYTAVKGYSGDIGARSIRQTDDKGVTSCMTYPFAFGTAHWATRRTYPLTQHFPEPLHIGY